VNEKPKNGWLISWDCFHGHRKELGSRVVSILPLRTPPRVVAEILKALFVATYPLSLCEKFHFGLNAEQRRLCTRADAPEKFRYGVGSETLLARKVKNIRRRTLKNGSEELLWTELARYRFDEEKRKMILVVDEREESAKEPAR
jgi:hypothetical protein